VADSFIHESIEPRIEGMEMEHEGETQIMFGFEL